jgi:hypothetical protein
MHTNETKDRFVELRAAGLSLEEVSKQINVCKRTLVQWNRDLQADIRAERAADIESLHDKIFASHEREAQRLAALQEKVETDIARRHFKFLSSSDLLAIRAAAIVRREIGRYRRDISRLYDSALNSKQPTQKTQPTQPAPSITTPGKSLWE